MPLFGQLPYNANHVWALVNVKPSKTARLNEQGVHNTP